MALYRKYRPATFAEVVGQEHVTTPLSTALDTGRINHAYLFSGPRGCGKTSSARILARSLNCVQGPTSRPCGECASCVALGPGGAGNLDVIELDAASHGGVDDTRELRDKAFYAPAQSRYRVFIVDEAHMVTTAGFNALLKIVEEPPEHLIFIFATTEPDKVLATIRSRTHHYPFRLLPPATMRGLLERITADEGVTVDEAVFPLVIRAGGGSPRDSLSILDQLLAGADENGVSYARASALLGVTDSALIDAAVIALAASDGAALFGTVERVMAAGHDPRRFAVDLLERLRDLVLLRAVPDAGERGLVFAPADALARMTEQARAIGPATLTRYAELLHAGLGEMRGATAPRLLLEIICARLLLPAVSDAESAVLQRLERLEQGAPAAPASAAPGRAAATLPAGTDAAPAAAPRRRGAEALAAVRAQATTPAPASTSADHEPELPAQAEAPAAAPPPRGEAAPSVSAPAPAAAPNLDRETVWRDILVKVAASNKTTAAMLQVATITSLSDDTLVLAHPAAVLATRLQEPHNARLLQDAVREVLGASWTVGWVGAAATVAVPPAAVQAAPRPKGTPVTYARRSQANAPQVPPAADDVPPPEEPADADYPPEEAEGPVPPVAEVVSQTAPARPTPSGTVDEIALRLLQDGLGARRIS